jgi:hypothetical protein
MLREILIHNMVFYFSFLSNLSRGVDEAGFKDFSGRNMCTFSESGKTPRELLENSQYTNRGIRWYISSQST